MDSENENYSLPRPSNNAKIEQEDIDEEESGITLGDIWRMIKKHWVALVICLFVGLAGGVTYGKAIKKPKYQSTGTMLINKDQATLNDARTWAGVIYNYCTTGQVKEAVGKKMIELGYKTSFTTNGTLDTSKVKYTASMPTFGSTTNTSLFIDISATTSNAKMSQDLVDTVMTTTQELIDGGDTQMSSAKGFVNISSKASEAKDTSTSTAVISLIGILIGAVVGAAYGIIRELTNVHVSSKIELENLTGYKVIGMIPKYGEDKNTGNEDDDNKKGDKKHAK